MSDTPSGRYLVTGATGFIGQALCTALKARGASVRALARRPTSGPWDECLRCDLAKEPLPEGLMRGIDGVFHLAGIAHVQDIAGIPDALYQRVNVDATRALLDAAVDAGLRGFVYFSSIKAVADPGERCVDEAWDTWPADAYGRSKREAEDLVLQTAREHGLHACNLRPCLVYGPGVKGNLARMLAAIDRGRFPPLPEFHNRRSMVSQLDLIEAAWRALHSPRAQAKTFIVGDAEPYSTRAMSDAMHRALGRKPPSWSIPPIFLATGAAAGSLLGALWRRRMPLDRAVLQRLRGSACYCSDLIQRELDWRPTSTLYTELPAMVDAYRSGLTRP